MQPNTIPKNWSCFTTGCFFAWFWIAMLGVSSFNWVKRTTVSGHGNLLEFIILIVAEMSGPFQALIKKEEPVSKLIDLKNVNKGEVTQDYFQNGRWSQEFNIYEIFLKYMLCTLIMFNLIGLSYVPRLFLCNTFLWIFYNDGVLRLYGDLWWRFQ